MADVHSTAIIEGEVRLEDDVVIGPHCALTGPLTLGPGTRLIGHVYLHGPLTMGRGNTVYPFACLGFAPQHAKYEPEELGQGLVIGDGNTFREHVTIHRAFEKKAPTRIGDRNYFMAASHAGHDCLIGSDCTFVNNSATAGHCIVEDRVIVGGGTVVHQFCRLGRGAMLSGAMGLSMDLPPWFMLTGNNVCGSINLVGLRRSGAARDEIDDVRWVYRTLYRAGMSIRKALEVIRRRSDRPMIAEYVRFIDSSERGICPARGKASRGTA
ncbi:MAG: acyl-ACP--UDP-N-acetylglucosamine O-acyltransferase [Planctomycetota bacterium]|nr:acyl-ACP--UDP-N-acetylglucosamine O-acyltransferase [Planctomycetota bacterium]